MSNIGKLLMATAIIMCFVWISQLDSSVFIAFDKLTHFYLFTAFPLFTVGIYLYLKAKNRSVN